MSKKKKSMTKKKISAARKSVIKRLGIAVEVSMDEEKQKIRNKFIDKFTLCDLSCKCILSSYFKSKNEKIKNPNLDMRHILPAMQMFDYPIQRNELSIIFGGSKEFRKRGTKSAKKLRDGIVHGMDAGDIEEMISRYDELFSAMDTYLKLFEEKSETTDKESMSETKVA